MNLPVLQHSAINIFMVKLKNTKFPMKTHKNTRRKVTRHVTLTFSPHPNVLHKVAGGRSVPVFAAQGKCVVDYLGIVAWSKLT